MSERITCIFLIIVLLLLPLSACGKDEAVSPVMVIDEDPLCFDPQIAETFSAKTIIANCYEGLVRLDSSYKIQPAIAESWDISPDGLKYTFHLSGNSVWQFQEAQQKIYPEDFDPASFNTAVTAYDFEFALRRAVSPETGCPDADKLFSIKNAEGFYKGENSPSEVCIKATDSKTLEIELCQKNDDFLRILTLPLAMPCCEQFFNTTHAKYGTAIRYTLTNGAYYLDSWIDDNYIILEKTEKYSGNLNAKAETLYYYINEDSSAVCDKVIQNSYDCAVIENEFIGRVSSSSNVICQNNTNTVYGMCFNCSNKVMSNINLRKALFLISDFEGIEENSSPADGIVPECCRYGDHSYRECAGSVKLPEYSEKEALSLWLRGLNEENLTKAEITVLCPPEYKQLMLKAIQVWQRVLGSSIVAKVMETESDELSSAINTGDYVISFTSFRADSATVSDFLKIFTTDSETNITGYTDNNYDQTLSHVFSEGRVPVTEYKRLEQMLIDNCVFYPVSSFSEVAAFNSDISGMFLLPAAEGIIMTGGEEK